MDNDELIERAAFGKQVELFWGSRVGSYLRDRAQECYTTAIQQLKTHNPNDSAGVQKLQNEIWKAEEFERWLSEAVLDGMKSLEILESDHDE